MPDVPGVRGGAAVKFHRRLDGFLEEVEDQISFLDELLEARRRPIEFIRLAASLLSAFAEAEHSGERGEAALATFVLEYSDEPELWARVSLPDLHLRASMVWQLLDLLEPGEWELAFKGTEGKAFRRWLVGASLDQPSSRAYRALSYLRESIAWSAQRQGRGPSQRLPALDRLLDDVHASLRRKRRKEAKAIIHARDALRQLTMRFRLGNLLYREVRCAFVHSTIPRVTPDRRRFWRNRNPYWVEVDAPMIEGNWEVVELPARMLLRTLRSCVGNYVEELRKRRRLPLDICNALYSCLEAGAIEALDTTKA